MRKRVIRLLMILAAIPLLAVLAHGQAPPKAAPRNKPCNEDTHLCSTRIKKDFAALEAYVRHLKPGAKVSFAPQADRAGDSGFEYGGKSPFQRLQYDLYDLSKYPPGPCKDGACHDSIDRASTQFGMLGNANDQAAARAAIADLKPTIDFLTGSIASTRHGK